MYARVLLLLLGLPALASLSAAQSFNYPDFSNLTGLTLNGSAAQAGTHLRITPSTTGVRGSAWYDQKVSVAGGFDTTFTILINQLALGGADGMAFVIHDDLTATAALGGGGQTLGYGPDPGAGVAAISNSLVLELDTYLNMGIGDPNANHLSVHTNGSAANSEDEMMSIGSAIPSVNLSSGIMNVIHTVRVRYVPGQLDVFIKDLTTPLLSIPYDFTTGGTWINSGTPVGGLNLVNGEAFVGFTGATGGAWENHDVTSWSFASGGGPTVYCTAKTSSCGSVPTMGAPASATSQAAAGPGSFDVTLGPVPGAPDIGILIYSSDGPLAAPTSGPFGFLCITPGPNFYRVLPPAGASGAPCLSTYVFDFGNYLATQTADPRLLPPGSGGTLTAPVQVDMQAWYRDPPNPSAANLSNAMSFLVQP